MLKLHLINELQTILNSNNVYIQSFKHSFELNALESIKLIIHSDRAPHAKHWGI